MGWKTALTMTLSVAATIILGGQASRYRTDPTPSFSGYIYPACQGIPPYLQTCETGADWQHCYPVINQGFNQCQHNAFVASGMPYPGGGLPAGSRPNRMPQPSASSDDSNASSGGSSGFDPGRYVGHDTTIWSMRAPMTPCSKVEWTPTDIPGVSTPTTKTASQDMVAEIVLHINSPEQVVQAVENRAKECAIQGAAAAGLTAYFTVGSAAWPTFKTYFYACMKDSAFERYIANLDVRGGGRCNW